LLLSTWDKANTKRQLETPHPSALYNHLPCTHLG
jgi:hypothetical protein